VESVNDPPSRAGRASRCGGSSVNVLDFPALSSPNSGLAINNNVVLELDVSYFFTPNIAAELILG
jgi:outer membrane protein